MVREESVVDLGLFLLAAAEVWSLFIVGGNKLRRLFIVFSHYR